MNQAKYSTYELRIRAVQALRNGMPVTQVAQAYQVDQATLYRWRIRYEQADGMQGLLRTPGSGRSRKLQELTNQQLHDIVLKPASAFDFETDFWTAKRLHRVITQRYDSDVTVRTILRRLQEAGLTYQKPTREYTEADPVVRQQWLRETLPKIRSAVQDFRTLLYCEDEASISQTALLGKTWAPRGKHPNRK